MIDVMDKIKLEESISRHGTDDPVTLLRVL